MKTLLGALAALLILIGCQSPTDSKPAVTKVVVNSLWQKVTPSLSKSASRDVTGDDLVAYVENYNATTFDDYLRIYDSDEVPALENAPAVSVFVCNPATYEVNVSYENVPRSLLVENAVGWRAEAYGQLIFIDHVPPLPIVIPPPSMYAWYALYVVNASGGIEYEDHCGWTVDEVWDGSAILAGGWRNADHYRETIYNSFRAEVMSHLGWTLVEHQLYTAP